MSLRRFNGENGEIDYFNYGWKVTYVYKTDVSTTNGGIEQRRARWSKPIRKYALNFDNHKIEALQELQQFFRDMKGKYGTFLFFDDTTDTLQTIEDGYKEPVGGSSVTAIYLPFDNVYPLDSEPVIGEDIKVYVNGIEITSDISYDRTTNKITWSANNPSSTDVIQVKYKYYVKVRFDMDNIDMSETTYRIGTSSVNLIEVR